MVALLAMAADVGQATPCAQEADAATQTARRCEEEARVARQREAEQIAATEVRTVVGGGPREERNGRK